MTSLLDCRRAILANVGAAALLATTALLGTTTGTLGDPATACAKPKMDDELFSWCVDAVFDQYRRGRITKEQRKEKVVDCCYAAGGECTFENDDPDMLCACHAPEEPAEGPRIPQAPGPTEATQVPPPPPPGRPVVTLPSVPPVQTR